MRWGDGSPGRATGRSRGWGFGWLIADALESRLPGTSEGGMDEGGGSPLANRCPASFPSCHTFSQQGKDLGRFGRAIVEDRKTSCLQLAGDVDLFNQPADISGVTPGTQADPRIAGNLAGPCKLLLNHVTKMAAGGSVVHGTDEVEIPLLAPDSPVLPYGVAVSQPVLKDSAEILIPGRIRLARPATAATTVVIC